MAMDDRDPGADTSMFRAYVDHPEPTSEAPSEKRSIWIVAGTAIVVIAVVAALVLA